MKRIIFVLLLCSLSLNLYSEPNLKLYQDMLVTENLRLRTEDGHDGRKVITVLNKGSKVKIIEIDSSSEEVIDGIKSKWVEVEVQKNATDKDGKEIKYGVVGWCFGGYLKEIPTSDHTPDYKNGNGTIISKKDNGSQIIEIRKHEQKITIGDLASAGKRKVYSSTDTTNQIFTLQDNDEVEIFEIYDFLAKKENTHKIWFKIKTKEKSGFMYYGDTNPYVNNRMEVIEIINSSGKTWTVRKLTQSLAVFGEEDKVPIRDMPGDKNTNIIDYVETSYKNGHGQINFEIEAITEELDSDKGNTRWVRISYNGKTGWISGKYMSAERGGPTYYIPEDYIKFCYGWY